MRGGPGGACAWAGPPSPGPLSPRLCDSHPGTRARTPAAGPPAGRRLAAGASALPRTRGARPRRGRAARASRRCALGASWASGRARGAAPLGEAARLSPYFFSSLQARGGGWSRAAAARGGDSARREPGSAEGARAGRTSVSRRAAGRAAWKRKAWAGFWSRCTSWFPGAQLVPWSSEAWCHTSRSTGTSGGLRTPRASPPTCVWCSWWPISYGYSSGRWGAPRRWPSLVCVRPVGGSVCTSWEGAVKR